MNGQHGLMHRLYFIWNYLFISTVELVGRDASGERRTPCVERER